MQPDPAPLESSIEAESRLRANQRMESLGTMARGMAHEINNPLNVIINCAELVSDALPMNAETQIDLREILGAAERIRKVVQVMLRFSEPDSVHMTPTDPLHAIRQVVDLVRPELDLQGVLLDIQAAPELPLFRIRRRQIDQVLINLIQNAAEAMEGALEQRITITIRRIERRGLSWIRLSVQDTGEGIPEPNRERIFDPFFTTRSRHRHAGLGLTLAHSYVRDHQGELSFDSDGAGSTFHVDLPPWERGKSA